MTTNLLLLWATLLLTWALCVTPNHAFAIQFGSRKGSTTTSTSPRRVRQQMSSSRQREKGQVISLQDPHTKESPAVVLRRLADACESNDIDSWDVYGDYLLGDSSTTETSFLRTFEAQVAADLGKADAVFMPSGVMAQAIALRIHQAAKGTTADHFICHASSHLLLHEQESYAELLHMKPIIVETKPQGAKTNGESSTTTHKETAIHGSSSDQTNLDDDDDDPLANVKLFPHIPPMGFADVSHTLDEQRWSQSRVTQKVAACLLELPHRELGGKITPWSDIQRLRQWCSARKIALHCDGARLFESTVAYEMSPAQLAEPFDSVYISFYKGLGGLSGAMLCGDTDFCDQARIWLRRFGGNLYTLLPYVVSAYDGYHKNYKDLLPPHIVKKQQEDAAHDTITNESSNGVAPTNEINGEESNNIDRHEVDLPPPRGRLSFSEQRDKLRQIIAQLSSQSSIIPRLVTFDPPVPETNMVHGYLKCTAEEGQEWCRWITQATGVQVLRRIKPLPESSLAWQAGYRSMFEWTMGNANGQVPIDVFYEGWTALAETYLANHAALENGESPIAYYDNAYDEDELGLDQPPSDDEDDPWMLLDAAEQQAPGAYE